MSRLWLGLVTCQGELGVKIGVRVRLRLEL